MKPDAFIGFGVGSIVAGASLSIGGLTPGLAIGIMVGIGPLVYGLLRKTR